MADGRHFEKTVKLLYLCNRLTDFDKIWYSDGCILASYSGSMVNLKMQNGGRRHLEKSQKSRCLRSGLTDLYEIWYTDAKCVS